MYNVTFYNDTGLNGVDVAARPSAWLNGTRQYDNRFTVDALDIISDRNIPNVVVAATMEQLAHADLCEIGDYVYIVTATEPVAPDTTRVILAMDYWDSLLLQMQKAEEGFSLNTFKKWVQISGGIVTRYSYPQNADEWGNYGIDDPLMAPQLPMKLVIHNHMNEGGAGGNPIIQSLIDITDLGDKLKNGINGIQGITIYDGDNKRVEPRTQAPGNNTLYYMGANDNFSAAGKRETWNSLGPILSPGTKCYDLTFSNVAGGLGLAQAWNVKNALLSSVRYPTGYVDIAMNTDVNSAHRGEVTSITGKRYTIYSGIEERYYNYTQTPTKKFNLPIFWSAYRRFGIVTAKGDRAEFTPQDIADPTKLTIVADPRPDGCPYFRFADFHGDTSWENFFTGAVAGLPWEQAQLQFEGKAGSYMDTVNFKASQKQQANAYQYQQAAANLSLAGGLIGGSVDVAKNIVAGNMGAAATGALNMVIGSIGAEMSMEQTRRQYQLTKQNQLANFGFSQNVLVPEVMFPFTANIARDFIGNGCIVYDYQYQDADIERINTLLNMFGLKCCMPLTDEVLFGLSASTYQDRTTCYIEAGSVQLNGVKLPRWFTEGLQMQIQNGIRIHKTKPWR